MVEIPKDIEEVITRVDRLHDRSLLPRTDAPMDKYDGFLKQIFPKYQIRNITEFDYGRSYRYLIALSNDPDAAALDIKRIANAVDRNGLVETVNLAISVLANYFLAHFDRYVRKAGKLERLRSDEATTSEQRRVLQDLVEGLGKSGVRRLDPAVAALAVPDVETDLCEKGEATVADCLFFG